MKRALLPVVLALALAEPAAGVYVPRLSADHAPNGVEVSFRQTAADDATASLAVYVPSQYASTHAGSAPGTTIGRVSARVQVPAVRERQCVRLPGLEQTRPGEPPQSEAEALG